MPCFGYSDTSFSSGRLESHPRTFLGVVMDQVAMEQMFLEKFSLPLLVTYTPFICHPRFVTLDIDSI
jgi:hypothetical protein